MLLIFAAHGPMYTPTVGELSQSPSYESMRLLIQIDRFSCLLCMVAFFRMDFFANVHHSLSAQRAKAKYWNFTSNRLIELGWIHFGHGVFECKLKFSTKFRIILNEYIFVYAQFYEYKDFEDNAANDFSKVIDRCLFVIYLMIFFICTAVGY